jgi:hypothetical protein
LAVRVFRSIYSRSTFSEDQASIQTRLEPTPMRFLCFLLVLFVVVAGLIFYFPNLPGHAALVEQWNSLQKSSEQAINSTPLAGVVAPTDNITATRSIADRVLRPLSEAAPAGAEPDPEKVISDIRFSVASSQSPSAANINQALNLIHQALEERRNLVRMVNSAARPGDLDKVPGNWHNVRTGNAVDRSAVNRNERTSYWAQTARAQWQQRVAAYRQSIDQLLIAANTGH